jgi:hypothetical protein
VSVGIWLAIAKGGWKLASSKPVRLALARYILNSIEKAEAKRELPTAENPLPKE